MRKFVWKTVVLVGTLSLAFSGVANAQYGIFDKTADWGPIGNSKVEGNVQVTGTGKDAVYTLEGNGNDIWGTQDEGFFVYTEKEGSWLLQGRLGWLDPGPDANSKIGFMVRENGAAGNSRYYWPELRGSGFGDQTHAQYRPEEGQNALDTEIFEEAASFTSLAADAEGFLWLRVIRFATLDKYVSEWSRDGVNWNPGHSIVLPGWQSNAAFGLAITSHTDDDFLALAEFNNVELIKIPFETKRTLSSSEFSPGRTIDDVRIDVYVATGETPTITLTETPPAGWTVSDIKTTAGSAQLSNGNIIWTINAATGNPSMTYDVTPPAEAASGEFRGRAEGGQFSYPIDTSIVTPSDVISVYFIGGAQADANLPRNTIYLDLLGNGLTLLDGNNQEVFIPGLKYDAQFISHDVDNPAVAANFDLVITHESVSSTAVGRYIDLPVPYLAIEQVFVAGQADREGGIWFGPTSGRTNPSGVFGMTIIDNTHPITDIYEQDHFLEITYNEAGQVGGMALDVLAPVAVPLGVDGNRAVLMVAEQGESGLRGDSGLTPPPGSEPLPARRAYLGYHELCQVYDLAGTGIENIALTPEAAILFQRVVQWMVGLDPTADGTEAGVPVTDWAIY